jgi:periplasmic protein TonB
MAYLDDNTGRNTTAIGIASALHVVLGLGLLYGLNPSVQKAVNTIIEAKDVKEEKKVEEEPPPPPEKLEELPPYVPPPDININMPPPPSVSQVVVQQEVPRPTPAPVVVAAPAPAPPAPREVVKTASSTPSEIMNILRRKEPPEFPPSVQSQMENEGKASTVSSCAVYISEKGRIDDAKCEGSGFDKLDRLAERQMKGVKVKAATVDGVPVGGWVKIGNYKWVVPK